MHKLDIVHHGYGILDRTDDWYWPFQVHQCESKEQHALPKIQSVATYRAYLDQAHLDRELSRLRVLALHFLAQIPVYRNVIVAAIPIVFHKTFDYCTAGVLPTYHRIPSPLCDWGIGLCHVHYATCSHMFASWWTQPVFWPTIWLRSWWHANSNIEQWMLATMSPIHITRRKPMRRELFSTQSRDTAIFHISPSSAECQAS